MRTLMRRLNEIAFLHVCCAGAGPGASSQQANRKADTSKYGTCILMDLIKRIPEYGGPSLLSHQGELNADMTMEYHAVTKPILFNDTHSHNNAELLCFIGGNPLDITDLGAEIDMSLRPEHETHVITKTSCVSTPANLPHCP